jgi:hypothetical protein
VKERIANIFLYIQSEGRVIHSVGVRWHFRGGTDAQKLSFLRKRVKEDHPAARRHRLPEAYMVVHEDGRTEKRRLTWEGWQECAGHGMHNRLLEDTVFCHYKDCPQNPLVCVTCVVDGVPRFDGGLVDLDMKPGCN